MDILSISLLAGLILIPRGRSRGYWPASLGLMLLFFCYACFNVGIADPKLFGLFELSKMVRGLTIFLAVAFYVRSERELRLFILALGLIVCYEGALALKQRYLQHVHRVFGTVDDSNSLSMFLCLTGPVLAKQYQNGAGSPAGVGSGQAGEVLRVGARNPGQQRLPPTRQLRRFAARHRCRCFRHGPTEIPR